MENQFTVVCIGRDLKAFYNLNRFQKWICKLCNINPQVFYSIECELTAVNNQARIGDVLLINNQHFYVTWSEGFKLTVKNNSVLTHVPEVSGIAIKLYSAFFK